MQSILEVKNLHKSFDRTPAVRGISIEIMPGEIFGLLGANGAGKTTTIQMLLGVLAPDQGEINVFGKSLFKHREEILKQMNFSSSYVQLPDNLKTEENLYVFGKLYEVPNIRERIKELMALFQLEQFRKMYTGKLSSGQLTRLYLAKALINKPRLLLLDEPTASLDPDIADRVRTVLKGLVKDNGTTILYTSHNMAEVEQMCDRLAFLHHGKILAQGTPQEIIKQYSRRNLEDVFLHIVREVKEVV
ncbi:MAG: ABC transporter ATP-binding protein [bacterium]